MLAKLSLFSTLNMRDCGDRQSGNSQKTISQLANFDTETALVRRRMNACSRRAEVNRLAGAKQGQVQHAVHRVYVIRIPNVLHAQQPILTNLF